MKNKNNDYLNQECIVWLRMLDRLQEENIDLKKRFSDYLKNRKNDVYLEKLESLYSNLLNNDAMLSLLRHEIIDLNEMINKEARRNNSGTKRLNKRQNKIREDMKLVEEEFERVKQDFISNTERANLSSIS